MVRRLYTEESVHDPDELGKVVRGRFRHRRHDRVLAITWGQELDQSLSRSVPRNVPLHVWDLSDRDTQWALALFEAGEQGLWRW